jgi:hypothetical protein
MATTVPHSAGFDVRPRLQAGRSEPAWPTTAEQRYVAGAGNPMNLNERPTWNEAEEAISLAAQALAQISEDLAVALSRANAEEAGQKPG